MVGNRLTGGEIILRALGDQDVDVLFGYPGGVTLPLYDKIFQQNKIRHILVGHEQGGVHAAEGYARSTGKTGVVLATSGPGATNTVTGLVDAMMDSIPLVCITGQVVSSLIGNDAFQEADTTGITRAATKHNYLVRSTDDLARIIHEAFYVAKNGRPGPVLIDIPKDVILGTGEYVLPEDVSPRNYKPKTEGDEDKIKEAVDLLAGARKPIIYVGGGVINSGPEASKLVEKLVDLTGYPCTTTLMALGALPASHPNFLGMPGMHGTYEANMVMHECDVMLNIGARFDDRVTGKVDGFSPQSKKIHIDIDPSSINKNVFVDIGIIGDAQGIVKKLIEGWSEKDIEKSSDLKPWWNKIKAWREINCLSYKQGDQVIKPQYALERLREIVNGDDVYVTTDVGQHQMWAAQFLHFEEPNRWMTSGGLGTMGYGVPAAMGVQVAHPNSKVICVTSEGSLMMNIQEMATISKYNLPVKIFNLNNKVLGMIRQWQELFHGNNESECDLSSGVDFIALAKAFGFKAIDIVNPAEVDSGISQMLEIEGPVFLNIAVDRNENVFPMIPAGAAHNEIVLGPNQSIQNVGAENNVMA